MKKATALKKISEMLLWQNRMITDPHSFFAHYDSEWSDEKEDFVVTKRYSAEEFYHKAWKIINRDRREIRRMLIKCGRRSFFRKDGIGVKVVENGDWHWDINQWETA